MGRGPLTTLMVCLLLVPSTPVADVVQHPGRQEVVCRNIDIRNSVQHFHKLDNCTVIEGYLQILLIDNGQVQDYQGLSFPQLVEITGYLLFYRVFGMNSIGKIFPNLSVIRGNILFHNYAFVVFEMYQLQEIGLSHLTDILRGSVRIEKNPGLCYVDTVDWDQIAKEGKGGEFIKGNKKWEECPKTCPEPNLCPISTKKGSESFRLCWNPHNCQKVCSHECEQLNKTCSSSLLGNCCHQECLGGCNGIFAENCVACRHVVYQGRCMKKCPPNTYEFMGRRCIQEEECKNYSDEDTSSSKIYWKPFMGRCIQDCPSGYVFADDNKHTCKKCVGKCPKVCAGLVVDNVAAAQNLRGCTFINGSLDIQIQGGTSVIKELEDSLSMIKEIQGYLKVARSFPLVSLNFLKSLTEIRGEQLDKKNYALLVLDNQNLQELWDWKKRTAPLRISRGKIFFHFNSKLCLSKIHELKKYGKMLDWDERDVSPSSNGDRIACDVTNMNVTVHNLNSTSVEIGWDSSRKNLHDSRSLLGYVIYYREAQSKNITIFDGRDACGTDAWKVKDVEFVNDTLDYISYSIRDLKPFSQYALYIRTYTTASSTQGAQSPIIYFKTHPDTPSFPRDVKAHSPLHDEIVISWLPPKTPNGNVTYYIIEGASERESIDFVDERNYCLYPLTLKTDVTFDKNPQYNELTSNHFGMVEDTSNSSSRLNGDANCCACTSEGKKLGDDEEDAEFQIHFEDFLHNNVYIKNPHPSRRRRELIAELRETATSIESSESEFVLSTPLPDGSKFLNGKLSKFKNFVHHQNFLVVSHLKHFTMYTIEVKACQDARANSTSNVCSEKAIASVRTLPLGEADDIRDRSVKIENITAHSSFVKWEEPKDPNGVIIAYYVEYQRLNGENNKPVIRCTLRSSFLQDGGLLLNDLASGNYSLRVRTTSSAGHGNWTLYIYFSIPVVSGGFMLKIILSVAVVIFIIMMFGVVYGVYKWKNTTRHILYASANPEYFSTVLEAVYEPDEWEIDREKVELLQELGQGSFGMVYKGHVKNFETETLYTPCAVKTVNDSANMRERIEFLQEASVMKTFSCHHVIKLLGVVSRGHPTFVIMELMTNGDLKSYLRSHRPDSEENPGQAPTLKQILRMCAEIADGMAYLAAKKFVHRDLAARNCMVAEDLTVKIGDFGMTRDVYETDYYRKGGKGLLPVRWMSPESLKDGKFDSQSDIWSYGVVLWEMATLASQPYQGLSNEDVLKFVIAGKTMNEPENCPAKLYSLMVMCWHRNPKARPTFVEIVEMLLPDVSLKFHQVSFYHNQRHLFNTRTNEDVPTPSTPLRSAEVSREDTSDSEEFHFFPSVTQLPGERRDAEVLGECSGAQQQAQSVANSNDSSKAVSLNYGDGSKGSCVSNGNIANGHANTSSMQTTNC